MSKMVLAIQLKRISGERRELDNKIHVMNEFINYFSSKLRITDRRLAVSSKSLNTSFPINSIDIDEISRQLEQKSLSTYVSHVSIQADFEIGENKGLIELNNHFDSKSSAGIVVEVFDSYRNEQVYNFSSLLLRRIIDHRELDSFFAMLKEKYFAFQRAFVEFDDEDDSDEIINPLNICYFYDIDKRASYRNTIKVLGILEEQDDDRMAELFSKIREYDQNFLAYNFSQDDCINEFAQRTASQNNSVLAFASFKLYAESKGDIFNYYKGIIENIFVPWFMERPSVLEMKKKVLEDLEKKLEGAS